MTVRVQVDPHPDNRFLCVEWLNTSDGMAGGRSCKSVEGEQEKYTHYERMVLGAGRWTFVAYVLDNSSVREKSAEQTITIEEGLPGAKPQ